MPAPANKSPTANPLPNTLQHEDDIQTLQIIEEGEDEEEEEEAGGSKLFYTYRVRVANVG